jgi:hypothetical protein
MLGRVPIRDVQSLDEVMAFVESTDGQKVIIFDVDNTPAPQGVPLTEFGQLVNSAIDRVEANPSVARVIALSNGAQREVARMVSRGNKAPSGQIGGQHDFSRDVDGPREWPAAWSRG